MPASSRALITELKRNKRFMGTCPSCGNDFRLADAVMFSLNEQPPAQALVAIKELKQQIKERKDQLAKARERMTKRAQNTAAAVNLGKIVEKIVPSFSSFPHIAGDCRALFEPIDYLIFSGLTRSRQVDLLSFVDVKSGAARLTQAQKAIKEVVESGALSFGVTKP